MIGDTDSINTPLDRKIDHTSTGGRRGRISQGLITPQLLSILCVQHVEVPVTRADIDQAVILERGGVHFTSSGERPQDLAAGSKKGVDLVICRSQIDRALAYMGSSIDFGSGGEMPQTFTIIHVYGIEGMIF